MIRPTVPSLAVALALAALLALPGCLTPMQKPVSGYKRVAPSKPLEQLQRDFVELRFGMFIHFGILTYTGSWSKPNLDIKLFNPTGLDPGQWADAAVAAKMKYGVLTTRHHDGFALWPSKAGDFNVRTSPGATARATSCASTSTRSAAGACARPLLLHLGHHRRASPPRRSTPPG